MSSQDSRILSNSLSLYSTRMDKIFGGKDPFDHPFFTQPFGGLFGGRSPFDDPFFTHPFDNQTGSGKRITIEEMNPDDDGGDYAKQNHKPSKELYINNPNEYETGMQSFSFQRVAYGGPDGPYYTSSIGRRTGGDGVVLMEMKEEDRLAGESMHTISKGIHHQGHSVTKKQSSDGKVDSLETLHNLNEDELAGFEDNWKTNADKVLRGWSDDFNLLENAGANRIAWDDFRNWSGWGGWPFPSLEYYGNGGAESNGTIKSAGDDFGNWSGWGGWPFPPLEHYGNGGAESTGEPQGSSTRGTSRKVIPIE